jgi:hypothetical protein
MALKIIDYNSTAYKDMVALRMEILRKPLGLTFSAADLEKEKDDIFLGAFDDEKIMACCVLTKMNMNEGDTGGWVMPRLIEVSGFTFKPIHTFIPKTVNIDSITQGGQLVDAPFINFGKVDSSATNGFGYGTKINNINASQNNTNTIGGTTA